MTFSINVSRFNPETDDKPELKSYVVPREERTVLQALIYIYEQLDSTLGFRYGCRYKKCGLCAVEVDGVPRLACLTRLKNGMTIRPLAKLPLIRDLITDRKWLLPLLTENRLFIPQVSSLEVEKTIQQPEAHKKLSGCVECLGCLAACPQYEHGNRSFGGPFLFVKLAQQMLDPRDVIDRKQQAITAGIENCHDCHGCNCTIGIDIYRLAIRPLVK